uniref:Pectinesterase inhibitor domain-containing protein n=1 Tax=Leersia perrieri TaxID=77586 RepID=A0A0D9X3P4_9ORYZ
MALLLLILVAFAMPTTVVCSRSSPSSKHGHGGGSSGGHGKRSPPPAPAQVVPTAAALVKSTCNTTAYYDVCVSALAADPSSTTADIRGLSSIAVSAAAANASGAAQAAAALANASATSPPPSLAAADATLQSLLRTCAAKYGDARDALAAAKESIGQGDYEMATVHVSAAAEYPQVCKALFRRQRPADYPPEIAAREEALNKLCSVALDIIALLNSSSSPSSP